MKPNSSPSDFALLAACLILQPSSLVLAQGNLVPPGAPAATMKTLDQVEPRLPLVIGSPGVTTEANYHFVINQPGSYYLAGGLAVTKTHGIVIRAEGVTLDLMGFEIRRTAGVNGFGIEVDQTAHRYAIKNGSIGASAAPRLLYGILCQGGIGAMAHSGSIVNIAVAGGINAGIVAGDGCHVDRCEAHDNLFTAIEAGPGSTVTNCTAAGNQGFAAIRAGEGSTLVNCTATGNAVSGAAIMGDAGSTLLGCTARGNSGPSGISGGDGSTLRDCTARGNTHTAPDSRGISAGVGCTLVGCTALANTSTNATLTGQTGAGISTSTGCTIKDCTASGNTGDGIRFSNSCHVAGCTSGANGSGSGNGAGLHATSASNRIDGNHVVGNDRGIHVESVLNTIIRNTAVGNAPNYDIAASNNVGAIFVPAASAAIAGSGAVASSLGTTDPWANLSK